MATAKFDAIGGRLTSFSVLSKGGQAVDLVLGPDQASEKDCGWLYFGALVGRVAGRISNGRFSVEGETFELEANDGRNLLHGGVDGFSGQLWSFDPDVDVNACQARFTLTSEDGDNGFPGEVKVTAVYSWEANNWLDLEITAQTSRPTPLNLTQHIYWNLGSLDAETIRDHLLQVHSDTILPVSTDLLPTGELRSVENTPFDFRVPRAIGECLDCGDSQVRIANGIDHCWIPNGRGFREVAILAAPRQGRRMSIWSDQPGLQIYTANHLGNGPVGKGGQIYQKHAGIAFETQGFPDAMNHPHFPSIIVRPGELYRNRTRFVFTQE